MQKAYSRIIYKNYPSTDTPLNETNLNHMDGALDTIDDRVVAMDTTKANQADMLQAIKTIAYNDATGVFTITFFNNTSITIDTDIEKIAINFDYDDDPTSAHYQQIIIQLDDGTYKYIDLSALITQYEFDNSNTVAFTISGGRVSANVVDGSITEAKLQPNFLADVKAEVAKAEDFSEDAEAWAKGTRGGDPVESTDPTYNNNAKHYSEVASDEKDSAEAWANGQINGQDVPSTHPAYHNNAKYYKDLANPTTFKALTDVTTDQNFNGIDMTGIQDGQTIVFDNTTGEMVPGDAGGAAINDIFNVYGSKNLMPFPYYGTDCPIATIKDDGTIVYNGQRTQGMSSKVDIYNQPTIAKGLVLPAGDYKLSMEVDNIESQYMIFNTNLVYKEDIIQAPSHVITVANDGSGLFTTSFTLPSNVYIVSIYVEFMGYNFVLSNITVKSMLRRATVKDDTYASPAMTNRQLTLKHNVKDMFDTNISNPTPGQTLVYGADGKLTNATPSGSGHTILNSAGTALTPRTNLQFAGGLNATDDSNNNKSVVDDNYEIIPWTTWQGYTAAQKAQHPNAIVTDAPDCDGDVEIEVEKVLWANQNTSSSFLAARITLNSDDYDDYGIEYAWYVGRSMQSVKVAKGSNMNLYTVQNISSSIRTATRNIVYVDATHLDIEDATIMETGGSMTTNNGWCIPIRVIGYKKDLTAKIKAIAHDVSTSASKCMMSDDTTSVEDMITALSKKYKLIYNSGKFTADNTVALTDNVGDFKFLVARTGNSSDSSSSRSFGILPSMVASMGCYLPYNKGDKFLRINASSTSFRLIECTSGEYIYQIYGVY